MSLFAKLPSVVVQHIICIVAKDGLNDYRHWKHALPLLAICHSWREYGIPIIYNKVIFHANVERGQGFNYANGTGYTQTTAGFTNIGLYQSTRMSAHAKELSLMCYNPQYLNSFSNDFETMFSPGNSDWSHITMLKLKLFYNNGYENNYIGPELNDSVIDKLVDKMYAVIPNIRKINIDGTDGSNGKHFAKSLIKKYLDRLEYIDCDNQEIISYVNSVNAKLSTSMIIDYSDETNSKYPLEVIKCLTSLTIKNIKGTSIRDIFQDSSNQELIFPKLKKLYFKNPNYANFTENEATSHQFDFADSISIGSNTGKVLFPKLTHLIIDMNCWKTVQALILSGMYDLSNVMKLVLYNISMFNSDNSSNHPDLSNVANRLAHSIASQMPNLIQLDVCDPYDDKEDNLLANSLVKRLNDKLVNLSLTYPLHLESVLYLLRITKLYLNYILEGSENVIQYCAKTLNVLRLDALPNHFTLDTLNSSGSGNQTTIYSNLTLIELYYKWEEYDYNTDVKNFTKQVNQELRECTSKFPVLGSMKVRCKQYTNLYNVFGYINQLCPLVKELTININDIFIMNRVVTKPNKELSRAFESLANIIFASFPHVKNLNSAMTMEATHNFLAS